MPPAQRPEAPLDAVEFRRFHAVMQKALKLGYSVFRNGPYGERFRIVRKNAELYTNDDIAAIEQWFE